MTHPLPPFHSDSNSLRANVRNTIDGHILLTSVYDASIAAAFFDPQYRGILDKLSYGNEGVQRGRRRSSLRQMQQDEIMAFLKEIDRVLVKGGHLFLWVDKFHLCEGVLPWFEDTSLELVDMIVWYKDRMGMGYRTRRTAEYLVVFQKPPKRAKGIWTDRKIPDVWKEKLHASVHTHAKPIDLQRRLIEAVTRESDWILDPAAGSYSVLAACELSGRNFIGGDIDGSNSTDNVP